MSPEEYFPEPEMLVDEPVDYEHTRADEQGSEDGRPPLENIKIYLRVRPLLEREDDLLASGRRPSCVQLSPDGRPIVSLVSRGMVSEVFEYDFVGGPEVPQDDVFEAVGRPITENCLQGYNGTIFAYGQTGSGKTFTMQGPADILNESGSSLGLIPRTLRHLFARIAEERAVNGTEFTCRCSYIEIYNETIYDLLDGGIGRVCNLRENTRQGGVFVEEAAIVPVHSPEEAFALFASGAQNRHVAATAMNRESSRSHSVFTLFIESRGQEAGGELVGVRAARFNLVDLAGSERQQLTGAVGVRLKEAGSINRSLLALSNVINALVETAGGRPRHVHYRDSKLTFLLRDSLGGNAKTCIVACVSPAGQCHAETLSTLRFAQRAKLIQNTAVVNEALQGDIPQLQAEIRRLQTLLNRRRKERDSLAPGALPSLEAERALRVAMERQTELSAELMRAREQLEALEELSRRKDYTIRAERLLRKLREASHMEHGSDEQLEERHALEALIAHNPEVVRLAMDNTRLRERLGQIDSLTLADFDALQTQLQRQQQHIDTLTRRLITFQSAAAEDEDAEKENAKRRRLSVDMKLLEANEVCESQAAELAALKERLSAAGDEEVRLREAIKQKDALIAELEGQVRNLNGSIQNYQQQQEQMTAEQEAQKATLSEAQLRLFHLAREKNEIEERLVGLQCETEARMEQAVLSAQAATDQLNRFHAAKLAAVEATARSTVDELERRAASEALRLRETIGGLESSLAESQHHVANLTAELDVSRAQHRALQRSLEEARQADAQRLSFHAASSQSQSEELSALRLELAHLRKALADGELMVSAENDRNAQLAKAVQVAETRAKEAEERLSALQSRPQIDETRYKLVMAENAQLQQRIAKLESMLKHASESVPRSPVRSDASQRLEQKIAQLQAAYNSLFAEKEGLLEDNAKLIQHHNAKQKLHYHVKIKEENNRLKQELQAVQAELAKYIDVSEKTAVDLT